MDLQQMMETSIVTGGMGTVLFYLNNKADTETELAVLGYLSCSFLIILLHQTAPLFHVNPVKKKGIYRSINSQGVWSSFLIPAICVLGNFITKTDDKIDSSLLFVLLTLTLTLVHYNPSNASQIAGALLLLWLKEIFKQQDLSSIRLCVFNSIFYYSALSKLPKMFPMSFSYGESVIVLQSTFLIVNKFLFRTGIFQEEQEESLSENAMIKIAMLAILGVFLASVLLHLIREYTSKLKFYIVYSLVIGICLIFGLPRQNPVVVLLEYFSGNLIRFYLVAWYGSLTAITVTYMMLHSNQTSVSSAMRKFFHVIIVGVYIPGLLLDPTFLTTASLLAFCVMFVIETLRYMDVQPFGKLIEEKYKLFLDKQDEGPLALTPIYLILGLSLPLWLSFIFRIQVSDISVYAGVISVGIGDAVASVIGSKIGRFKWPGSSKTIEGSLASLVTQIVTLYCLRWTGKVESSWTFITLIAVTITTVLEAVTTQIDNLVLPLFLYTILLLNIL
ncbi:dolichol kinase-like [Mytilus californianus]|uniref:dolichol kinase-like n=1 Tax=Mytilus californianus TaxID=6549 RepID=UPI0022477BE2|nr:dolichol kinase-like [Mytilus californianus]XP_052101570.1 dolichol kinase-like [Mytilus californianus]